MDSRPTGSWLETGFGDNTLDFPEADLWPGMNGLRGVAEKTVYSRTLEPRSTQTRIEREFDPGAVRRLKAAAAHDITVDGPELAAQAIRASLVDEPQMIV